MRLLIPHRLAGRPRRPWPRWRALLAAWWRYEGLWALLAAQEWLRRALGGQGRPP